MEGAIRGGWLWLSGDPWKVVGDPLGGPWESLRHAWGVVGGSPGGAGSSSLRAWEAPEKHQVSSMCLGGLGSLWGDFGCLEWASGPTCELKIFTCLSAFMCDFCFDDLKRIHELLVVSWGDQHVDVTLVFIRCSDMRVLSQMRLLNDSFQVLKGTKRIWLCHCG